MLSKLSTILLASLLLAGACAEDSGSLGDDDKADKNINWTTEGIGEKLIDLPLRDNNLAELGSLAGLKDHPGLTNLKFHASQIDSNDPTRILIIDDIKGTYNDGDDKWRSTIYNSLPNVVTDVNVHPEHAFAFWARGTKYFGKLTQVNENFLDESNVILTLYTAAPTPGVVLDAFMGEDSIVEFEDGDNRYQLTLTDVDNFGTDQAEFLIEKGKVDCYWPEQACENLKRFAITEDTTAISFDLGNGELKAELLTEVEIWGQQRVRISVNTDDTLPPATDCTSDSDCPDVDPVEPDERPEAGTLDGACVTHPAFPDLDGDNGNCQVDTDHCDTSYADGLCPTAASNVRCCVPTPL